MLLDDAFLDLLYQAPARPTAWIPVMERLSDLLGGAGAWLSTINVIDGAGEGLWARVDPHFPRVFFDYYAARNPLNNVRDAQAFMRAWQPRIITDADMIPTDTLEKTEFYNDFLRPLEATSVAMIRLARHEASASASVINIGRGAAKGPFQTRELEVAEALHPHLIRAFRLGMEVARARLEARVADTPASAASRAVMVLDGAGRVLSANAAAETLFRESLLAVRRGRLTLGDPRAAERLAALVARACALPPAARVGGLMAVPIESQASPVMLTVTPLEDEASSLFLGGRLALVVVANPAETVRPTAEALKILYGLTPAEGRLALALLDGATLKETAERLGVSANTAAIHLSRIFDKTGVNRQAALAALLTRVALHR